MTSFGPLIMDVFGMHLQEEDRELIAHPLVGGIILFTRNYESTDQLHALISQIRAIKTPLLIMVDQEGGRVQRFKKDFTLIPPAAFFGKKADLDLIEAENLAETWGSLMAREILNFNIDLSFAPVLDIDKHLSSIIGDRAFHQDVNFVIPLAKAFIKGMKDAGMKATGKHFPGHGSVCADSHLELPVDTRTFDEIASVDLQPFVYFIQHRIPALMTAHILFPNVDSLPVTFSPYWLKDILRNKLQYKGVVISDDLTMKGAERQGDYPTRVGLALDAGCDMVLLCNNRKAVLEVVDQIKYSDYLLNVAVYEKLKGHYKESLHESV